MLSEFVKSRTTHKQCEREFADWHKGIPFYGFWAIEITDPAWLLLIESAQAHVKPYAQENYLRAPHITLTACGLMHENEFSTTHLAQQITALQALNISPFFLEIGSLSSFTTAMYLGIKDRDNTLDKLRACLSNICTDNPPDHYQAHITLGLYRDSFDTSQVADSLRQFNYPELPEVKPLKINEIVFCRYQTRVLQGPYDVKYRLRLMSAD